jgi:hypothetical protein
MPILNIFDGVNTDDLYLEKVWRNCVKLRARIQIQICIDTYDITAEYTTPGGISCIVRYIPSLCILEFWPSIDKDGNTDNLGDLLCDELFYNC